MMKQFIFEELTVWQKAMELVKQVYQVTLSFPKQEQYGLTDQIKRAVVSVSLNIAEGKGLMRLMPQFKVQGSKFKVFRFWFSTLNFEL